MIANLINEVSVFVLSHQVILSSVAGGAVFTFVIMWIRYDIQISTLKHRNKKLEDKASADGEGRQKSRQFFKRQEEKKERIAKENDVGLPENQLRMVSKVGLRKEEVINDEASKRFEAIEGYLKNSHPVLRLLAEVPLGVFIKTKSNEAEKESNDAFNSYRAKRVDFLIINSKKWPVLAIEYDGSGHDNNPKALLGRGVKKVALEKTKIPLVIIYEADEPEKYFAEIQQHLDKIPAWKIR